MIRHWIYQLRHWRKSLRHRQPVVTLEISRSALLSNLQALRSLAPNWQVAPVLKSNAYGHGLVLVAELLSQEKNLPFFCIDSCFEAEVLRQAGVKTPLLIMGYTPSVAIAKNKLRGVSFVVGGMEQLQELIDNKTTQNIQLKFDTGMHRQGIPHAQLNDSLAVLKKPHTLQISGVLSHLADSEVVNSTQTEQQVAHWNEVAQRFQTEFPAIHYYHLANSGGFADHTQMTANVGRPGLALYGVNPGNLQILLRPVLSMKSVISAVRTIEVGEPVGYNHAVTVKRRTRVATVPVGYYEGVDRRLSNQGAYLINGQVAPLLGRVSMNISSCDVTDIPTAAVGSPVVVISNTPSDPNSIQQITKLCQTTAHEPLIHLPPHLRRAVVE